MEKKEPKIKIFVAHHKPGNIYEDDVYIPIQVGKKNAKIDLGILGDDTGDNISEKNSNYAELTAQYWVWKNYDLSNVDYVGFCHYRRYMTYYYRPNILNYLFAKNFYSPIEHKENKWRFVGFHEHNCPMKYSKNRLKKNSKKIVEYIKDSGYDIYMPKKNVIIKKWINLNCFGSNKKCNEKESVEITNFGDFYIKNEFADECINLFLHKYPEQKNILKKIDKESERVQGYRRHLFIMKKDLFLQYMERLFGYLFELENLIKEKNLDIKMHWVGKNDGRFMGIFAESLINYWIEGIKERGEIKVSSKANTIMFADYYL